MKMALFLEASPPSGIHYRFGFAVFVPLELVSMMFFIGQWF